MNQEYRKRILKQFDSDLAQCLLEFGEILARYESDVFVLMSRKFCCLYKLLLTLGITPINKPVVSDGLLYTNTDLFKDKVVTIVDDIIILGTSIFKRKNDLITKFKAKEVKVCVFCTNKEYWEEKLVNPEYKTVVLPDNRALNFCTSIVTALSLSPIPYSMEYPIIKEATIKEHEWNLFATSGDWIVSNITSNIQRENNISVFTVFPSDIIINKIKRIIGEQAYNLIEIHKIRIYTEQEGELIKFNLLPIVTLKSLSDEKTELFFKDLIEYLKIIGCSEKTLLSFIKEFDSPITKLRFIQYTASLFLFSFFKHSICKILCKEILFNLNKLDVELFFGYWNVEHIEEMCNCFFSYHNKKQKYLNIDEDIVSEEYNSKEFDFLLENTIIPSETEIRDIFADFNNIFLIFFYKKELEDRKIIKKMVKDGEIQKIQEFDRLEKGITWNEIVNYFENIFKCNIDLKFKMSLSLVLDYSIDRGICVPIVCYDKEKHIVYRAYRHGEDVSFAEQEIALCGHVIKNAQDRLETDVIPKLFLEKLLVLFIKIGVNLNIFKLQHDEDGHAGVSSVDFYLQGAIPKFYNRNKRDHSKGIWLHKYLLEKKIIKKINKNNEEEYYSFEKTNDDTVKDPKAKRDAKDFGTILGGLYKGYQYIDERSIIKTKHLTTDDFIYLSTLSTPEDVSKALRAEIEIYINNLSSLININNVKQKKFYNLFINNIGYIALNSLHDKAIAWVEDKTNKAIEKGYDILKEQKNAMSISAWEMYWDSMAGDRVAEKDIFDQHTINFAITGHRLLFYLNILEVYLLKNSSKDNLKKLIKYYNNAKRFTKAELFSNYEEEIYQKVINHNKNDWIDVNEENFLSFIIKGIIFYNEKAKKNLLTFQNALDIYKDKKDKVFADYMIYYDIIDSTGTKRAKNYGKDPVKLRSYKLKVFDVKTKINELLQSIMQNYHQENNVDMFIWNGDEYSNNDSKHVFFPEDGKSNNKFIKNYIHKLLEISRKYDIFFRIIICSGSEFNSRAFKYKQRMEYQDKKGVFWVYFARIEEEFKKYQKERDNCKNWLLIIDNTHKPNIDHELELCQQNILINYSPENYGVVCKTEGKIYIES
jgi:hypothetical protein